MILFCKVPKAMLRKVFLLKRFFWRKKEKVLIFAVVGVRCFISSLPGLQRNVTGSFPARFVDPSCSYLHSSLFEELHVVCFHLLLLHSKTLVSCTLRQIGFYSLHCLFVFSSTLIFLISSLPVIFASLIFILLYFILSSCP